jgi:hypothetical protein
MTIVAAGRTVQLVEIVVCALSLIAVADHRCGITAHHCVRAEDPQPRVVRAPGRVHRTVRPEGSSV